MHVSIFFPVTPTDGPTAGGGTGPTTETPEVGVVAELEGMPHPWPDWAYRSTQATGAGGWVDTAGRVAAAAARPRGLDSPGQRLS